MRVDLASLGTFNRIGTAGAQRAADALATLTGMETFVETNKINFAPVETVSTLFGESETAVGIEFDGGLEGQALLVFDEASAEQVLSELASGETEPTGEYLHEVANIMTSSFVDGWAEHLDEIIDISTPSTVDSVPRWDEHPAFEAFSFVFESDIAIGSAGHECRFYLVPEPTGFLEAIRAAGDESPETDVNVRELSTFIRLTAAGAETVATNLEAMTGIETDVAVSHLDFIPVEDVPGVVEADQHVGTVFQFSGAMDGYLAVLFEDQAANTITGALTPNDPDEAMRQSAIEEIGNITASGFVDGWANALDTTIDHSVPDFVDDMGRAVLESIAVELGMSQEFAYVFDVVLTADEPMTCRLFAFPEADGFRSLVSSLDADLDISSVERV
ncbi:Chemotaxis protein CheC, inhibitor of MCP methylation [Halanaeroarchaeum sp. HSR-CO]|uniref:chemotaxis protein CheC n=1 Tax=Halanaeroarchaeum sp. HSR-CO TaxID=2866382 RepID=UPI00217DBEC6|nr:chemotaxis protein CheC [Halanaeroarchaeum sp. HSR-CO]UWG48033.1 Chemotaxis protein CheC, inhibitor of MCP methylation [Halanaeroarchaeum sp. HSR-CO]